MTRPGSRNLVTDVDGIAVGNAEDRGLRSGVTVILPEAAAVAAVEVRGGAPGTRETDALEPTRLVECVDAVALSGGSAFGLDAAAGAMAWLAERGRGFAVGETVVPIVPAAILFDLGGGQEKSWGEEPPYRRLGLRACEAAGADFALGNAGAGLGAVAGKLKGGLGSASAVAEDGLQVGAVVAANPVGSVVVPGEATFWAWALEQENELGGQRPPRLERPLPLDEEVKGLPGANTTIGVAATNAALSPAQARQVAVMAQDGLARAIRPVHTPFDGDTLFVLATGTWPLSGPAPGQVARVGSLAADCVARAVARGVFLADSLGGVPSYRELYSDRLAAPS